DPSVLVPAVTNVEVGFTKGTFGPFVGEDLAIYGSNDEAGQFMDVLAKTLDECTSWETTGTDGVTTSNRLLPLSFPKLGNATIAARFEASADVLSVSG